MTGRTGRLLTAPTERDGPLKVGAGSWVRHDVSQMRSHEAARTQVWSRRRGEDLRSLLFAPIVWGRRRHERYGRDGVELHPGCGDRIWMLFDA